MGDFDDDPEIRPQFHTFVDDPVTESELDPLRQIVVDGLSKAGWSWAVSQRLIPTGERSGLLTRTATTESVSLCVLTKN
jgi:hypothetical protein